MRFIAATLLFSPLLLIACSSGERAFLASESATAASSSTGSGATTSSGHTTQTGAGAGGAADGCGDLTGWQALGDGLSAVSGDGTDAKAPAIALDRDGAPLVAWAEGADATDIHVDRWDGAAWRPMGGALSALPGGTPAVDPVLAARGTNVVVAWLEQDDAQIWRPYVRSWNGSDWEALGDALSTATTWSFDLALVLDSTGAPLIAWTELGPNGTDVHVARWDAGAWQPLGAALSAVDGSTYAFGQTMVVDAMDQPWIAWQEADPSMPASLRLRRWNGTDWVAFGGGTLDAVSGLGTSTLTPRLVNDAHERPILAWSEGPSGDAAQIYVRRWEDEGGWTQLSDPIGTPSGDTNALVSSLAVDDSGMPLVLWVDSAPTSVLGVYASRYDGVSFAPLGGNLAETGAAPLERGSITVDSCGRPVAAWTEKTSASFDVRVSRYHGAP